MAHRDSVKLLTSLLRPSNEARPVFLLGAGASFSSGVPLAAEGVKRIAKRVFADKIKGGAILPEHVKLTEWQTWLHSQPWFINGDDRLAENFPLAVLHLLEPREYRARVLRDLVQPTNGIGAGYRHLADLVMRGLIRTVLTTNFDICLPAALHDRHPHIRQVAEVNRGPDDLREFGIFARAQIVWLHGKAEQYTDRNLLEEVEKLDAKLVKLLVPLLTSSPLIVIGYQGAEPSVMDSLIAKNAKAAHQYKNGIFWCIRPGETPHPNVAVLQRKIGGNFTFLEVDGFDELLTDLDRELSGEDAYADGRGLTAVRPLAFDDQPLTDATDHELDHDLMLTVMRDYCQKLGRTPVTRDTLRGLLREQGLLVTVDGRDVPTRGCILLFGSSPESRFSHAVVSATIAGKKRVVIAGNLIRQRRAILEWLESPDVNPTLRVKQRSTHEQKVAYPQRALVEVLVNMLVHRDYQIAEPALINVEPGVSIAFKNPGSLPDAVASRVTVDNEGRFRPLPNVSELRNRSLCDVFFGMQAMEREGTGLSDVEEMLAAHGGDASFVNDRQRGMFVARLFQPTASVGSKTVARDVRPTGVYVLNVLPFASLPEELSIVKLRIPLRNRPAGIALEALGTFIDRGDELWSFVPLEVLTGVLAPIADVPASGCRPRAEVEAEPEDRKILSWLLRKHFERYLNRFEQRGLVLEEGRRKGRRAYFEGREGGARTLVYDTPRRKGVSRQIVKQRADGTRAWFENEGFGYEVIELGGVWAVRIKPFYMFTGRDARKPLPAFTRTARATRRMKFDRNKNVDDDLTFWSRWLSEGNPTINIGHAHVGDLILDGTFLMVEVPEEGLIRDENQNRMPA